MAFKNKSFEWRAVNDTQGRIVKTLRSLPRGKAGLLIQYKQEGWIDTIDDDTEDGLVTLALTKIENGVANYQVFIDMLDRVTGMDQIVKAIEGTV